MTPMPVELLIALRNTFATSFSEEELKDLTLAMGIDYENIPGSTKSAKARELASYLWRRSLLTQLAQVAPALYPDVDWSSILADYWAPDDGLPKGDERPPLEKLDRSDLRALVRILADYPMFQTPSGRKTVLTLSGVDAIANVDLNGSARDVASVLAVQLNEYGKTAEGDYAIGRLMAYVFSDDALPPSQKDTLSTIAARYDIALV